MVYLAADKRLKLICSHCGAKGSGYDTLKERQGKHVPFWGIPAVLLYSHRRVTCATCGAKAEAIPWTQGKSPLTLALSVVLATWAKMVAWQVVAQLFGFHWNTVRNAVKDVVAYGVENREVNELLHLGIDEISRKKGHLYHTQIYDLIVKGLLWSGEDRTSETLKDFFEEVDDERGEQIEAVCYDMGAPYGE